MQVIYGDASNIYLTAQKRLIRVVYGQTQATPYACVLDPKLRNSENEIVVPGTTTAGESGTGLPKREHSVFAYKNSIVPGTVLVKTESEYVGIAGAEKEKLERPFGLLGQWVGGTFDNVKQTNQVSAWQGFDAVIDLLQPGYTTAHVWGKPSEPEKAESLSTLVSAYNTLPNGETRVLLAAGPNGLLQGISQKNAEESKAPVPVAELIEYTENYIRIKLLV